MGREARQPRGDAYVIDQLFTRQGLSVLDVDVGSERLPKDVHPAQAGTKKIADAIVDALIKDGVTAR